MCQSFWGILSHFLCDFYFMLLKVTQLLFTGVKTEQLLVLIVFMCCEASLFLVKRLKFHRFVLAFHGDWCSLFWAKDAKCHVASSVPQGSSMPPRKRTGRRPTPTSSRPLRAMTPSTAPEPSQHWNTCCCAKLFSTREYKLGVQRYIYFSMTLRWKCWFLF